MSAAEGVPKWILLEPVVFRRDDVESFPDNTEAPIRASGTTSWGAHFRIAFSLAEPPSISRLYAHLPGFPDPYKAEPLRLLAAHRYLTLLKVGSTTPTEDEEEEDEFVVAELALYVRTHGLRCLEAQANICFLRSSFTGDQLGPHKWDTARLPLLSTTNEDLLKLVHWQTDAVIPFQRWLCWTDYHRGILFWDVSKKVPALAVSFFWFPEDSYSLASSLKAPCSGNGGVSVVDNGRLLKFAYVARHDSLLAFGPLKPGTGFTITCHTLLLGNNGSMKWEKDYTVTSDDLPDYLQRGGIPMFPRVDIDRPHPVHCLFSEFGKAFNRMSVLSIDMSTKTVESFYLYMDANVFFQTDEKERLPTDDRVFITTKSFLCIVSPFLPCEFPRFCYLSRKRGRGTE